MDNVVVVSSPLTNPTLLVYLRCTMYCATLIDNIFTELNELNNNISSGLMTCDVTDHLPVFAICKHLDIKRNVNKRFTFIKQTDENCIGAFKNNLLLQNWKNVKKVDDVNIAYENVTKTIVNLYNNFPFKKVYSNQNNEKVNYDLQMACVMHI